MKKISVFGSVFSIVVLVIYAREAWVFAQGFMDGSVTLGFSWFWLGNPWWLSLCRAGMLVCGLLAPLMYFMRSRAAAGMAFSAFDFYLAMILLNLFLRFRVYTLVGTTLISTLGLLALTLVYGIYLHCCKEERYTTTTSTHFL